MIPIRESLRMNIQEALTKNDRAFLAAKSAEEELRRAVFSAVIFRLRLCADTEHACAEADRSPF
jgi:hypothetical protein